MKINTTVLVVAVTTVICFIIAAMVGVFVAVPEGSNPGAIATILGGTLATVVALLGVLVQAASLKEDVKEVRQHTTDLTNGLFDSKARGAVADVLPPHLDTRTPEQRAADDARRSEGIGRHRAT